MRLLGHRHDRESVTPEFQVVVWRDYIGPTLKGLTIIVATNSYKSIIINIIMAYNYYCKHTQKLFYYFFFLGLLDHVSFLFLNLRFR